MISTTSSSAAPSAPMTDAIYGVDETEAAVENLRKAFGEWTLTPTDAGRTEKVCAIIERVGSQVQPKNSGRLEGERSLREVCTATCQEAIDKVSRKFSKPESCPGEYDKLRASIRKVEKILLQNQSPLFLLDPYLIEDISLHTDRLSEKSGLRIGNSSPSPRFSHVGERGKRGEGLELTSQMVFGLVFLHSFAGL